MPLPRAINSVGPVQAGVEPLRAVWGGALCRQHEPHFVHISLRVSFGAEIATFPAPIGPGPGQTVKHLLGAAFTRYPVFFRQLCHRFFIRNMAPQKLWDTLFPDRLQASRHTGLAKILLRDDVTGNLRPACRHFHIVQTKYNCPVRIPDFRRSCGEFQLSVSVFTCLGKFPIDFHCFNVPRDFVLNAPVLRG